MGYVAKGKNLETILTTGISDIRTDITAQTATIDTNMNASLADKGNFRNDDYPLILYAGNFNPLTYYNSVAGTWGWFADTTTPNTWLYLANSTGTINDRIPLGTIHITKTQGYKVTINYRRNTDGGRAHFNLNNVDKGSIDTYGANAYNQTASLSLGTLTKGEIYNVVLVAASKHGSASHYYLRIDSIVIEKS